MDRTEKYLKLYPSFAKQFDLLTDKELAKLVRAFLSYLETDEEPSNLSPSAQMAFSFIINLSAKDKRGAPIGNSNAKKTNKTKKTIKNKKNKKNNYELFDFLDENIILEKNSKKNANLSQNVDNSVHNSTKNVDNLQNNVDISVDNFVDNSTKIENLVEKTDDFCKKTANFSANSGLIQNYDNNSGYYISLSMNNNIINKARACAHARERQNCIDKNIQLLRKHFEGIIAYTKTTDRLKEGVDIVIKALANNLTEPPNKHYTTEIIHGWVNMLTDDEFCKLVTSVVSNAPILKPNIYILKALENIINERNAMIEVWVC